MMFQDRRRGVYLEFLKSVPLSDRFHLKALYHLVKLINLYTTGYVYEVQHWQKILKSISFDFESPKEVHFEWVFSNSPKYQSLYALINLFHPTYLGDMKGWILCAYNKRGILGMIAFTSPPSVIKPRQLLGIKGNKRSLDGLNEVRGKLINTFLWTSKSIAFGSFRKSRGLKALYKAVFTEELYKDLKAYFKKDFIGIETTTLYSNNSMVFRGMKPLKVIKSTTEGISQAYLPKFLRQGELLITLQDKSLKNLIKEFKQPKGYYFLTPFDNVSEIVNEFMQRQEIPQPPLYPMEIALKSLSYSPDGFDKEWYKLYFSTEIEVLLNLRKDFSVDSLIRNFYSLLELHSCLSKTQDLHVIG